MDARTALDLVRGYHAKIVKPFEKLAEVLETAATAADQDAAITQKLKALANQVTIAETTTAEKLKALDQQVTAAEASAHARIAQATQQATQQVEQHRKQSQAEEAGAYERLQAINEQIKLAHARKVELENELRPLEDQLQKIKKDLAAMRSKWAS